MIKKILVLLLLLTTIVSLTGCEYNYLNSSNPANQYKIEYEKLGDKEIKIYYAQAEEYAAKLNPQIIDHINTLGLELLRVSDNEDINIISPLGSYISLALLYSGTSNTAKDEFDNSLGFGAVEDIDLNMNVHDLLMYLNRIDPNTNMIYANSVFVPSKVGGTEKFLNTATNYIFSRMTKIDFSEGAKKEIDVWMTNYTDYKFETALEEISPESSTLAINAFYFEAISSTDFLPIDYYVDDFHSEKGITTAEYQRTIGYFGYFEDDRVQVLNMPLGRRKMSITFIIPKDISTNELAKTLTNEEINSYISNVKEKTLEITIPQMSIKQDNNMIELLGELGVSSIFTTEGNLDGISTSSTLTQFVNKVGLTLNKSETKLSKIDVLNEMDEKIIMDFEEFYVNKPFIFVIKDHTTNTNIMVGDIKNLGY